ncbi:RNA polymerase sigma factor [Brevundimonas sp. PAMC22021]|uniref:RNA polymerase sigma factor n=1 Tax=Brevundimonas sp. PAMC22021 TaxID=2861285 RepID=UPI001C6278E7|nr:sigma-70 family RNA polymerase sigma factor [Brevundimonas sp. PAMC22021]QYF85647.1 sigma-70 family RNA polymerase sigma factor [Brevundimonas sp. PAMC22021]
MAYDGDQQQMARDLAPVGEFIRRLVLRRLGRADLAEDVAQETLLRLVEYARVKRVDSFYALGMRIAENLMNEQHRRERRWSWTDLSESLASGEPSPERIIEAREAVQTLARTLERMPRLRREIIVRRRIRHQSCAAIASDLGLSLKAVEKHVTRGLLDLSTALQATGAGRGGKA